MRLVNERSLSSILRSELLTTLISNDVTEKVNASGVLEFFGQISRDLKRASLKKLVLVEAV